MINRIPRKIRRLAIFAGIVTFIALPTIACDNGTTADTNTFGQVGATTQQEATKTAQLPNVMHNLSAQPAPTPFCMQNAPSCP